MEAGGEACRTRIHRLDDALPSQRRKDDPRRQDHGWHCLQNTFRRLGKSPRNPCRRAKRMQLMLERDCSRPCGALSSLSVFSHYSGRVRQSNISLYRFSIPLHFCYLATDIFPTKETLSFTTS